LTLNNARELASLLKIAVPDVPVKLPAATPAPPPAVETAAISASSTAVHALI
jgi:hypothetical protein